MRYTILVALLIALATVVGCNDKEPIPAENTMNSMDPNTIEMEKKKMQQSPETMEAPAAASEAPASGK
jgi:hypothetical protein